MKSRSSDLEATWWALGAATLALFLNATCPSTAMAPPFKTAYTFNAYCDGTSPDGPLVLAPNGNFYGATLNGGTNGLGTIFTMTPTGTLTTVHSFTGGSVDGAHPSGYIVVDKHGDVFGTTYSGGVNGAGTFWRWAAPDSFKVDYSFPTAADPYGLTEDRAGSFYGTTWGGGANGSGFVFKIKTTQGVTSLTDLHDFTAGNTDGGFTQAPLVINGSTIYGASYQGGANGVGCLFSLTTGGAGYTDKYDFTTTTNIGYNPCGMAFSADGKSLYVLNQNGGGRFAEGDLIQIPLELVEPAVLQSFTSGLTGANPTGAPILGLNGTIYGVCSNGGVDQGGLQGNGVVWSVHTDGSSFTPLFTLPNGGAYGTGLLGITLRHQSTGDSLLGACSNAPADPLSYGTIFQTTATGANPALVHDFYADGSFSGKYPGYGQIVYDPSSGTYWGTTLESNPLGYGSLYQVTTALPTYQVSYAHFFDVNTSGSDGDFPLFGPTVGWGGDVWGITSGSGAFGQGAAFGFDPVSSIYSVPFSLGGSLGGVCESNVVVGPGGNFYFTGSLGGAYGYGCLFQWQPSGTITDVGDFNGANGSYPFGPIVSTSDGIYGTASTGGDNNDGTIWKYDAVGLPLNLHSMDLATEGAYPVGLSSASNGQLVGANYSSGSGGGTVWKITTGKSNTARVKVITDFAASQGDGPTSPPICSSTGDFWCSCSEGGLYGYGSVLKITDAGKVTEEHSFKNDGTDGGYPYSQLTEGQDGNMWGTTYQGGISPYPGTDIAGTIYVINTSLPIINGVVDGVSGGPSGLGGDAVTIDGANLGNATNVYFNGVPVPTFTIVSPTQITAVVPVTAGTGPVSVPTSVSGTATSTFDFVIDPPSISSLSATKGPVGSTVVITGTNLLNATSVMFGSVSASFTVNNNTSITAIVPGNATKGKITVTTPGGKAKSRKTFTVTG